MLTCMCGGSANQRCLSSIVNGDIAKPAASSPPLATDLPRWTIPVVAFGASRPMPWLVPPATINR